MSSNAEHLMMKHTPLHVEHLKLGAQLVDYAGWAMPLRYESETSEHRAVRSAAGLFDLSHMGEIEVVGPQADRFLDYALVNSPSAIAPGRARYSMICAEDGGVIDDLVVYRIDTDRYMVVSNAANAPQVLLDLADRSTGFEVSIQDGLDDWALIAIQGPSSAAIVEALTCTTTTDLKYYAIRPDRIGSVDVRLARTGYTGEDGFEVYCRADQATHVWEQALAIGTPMGMVPAGLAARDSLRLESGMPLYGNELSAGMSPFDAGLGRVVDFDKAAPFVGRDALLQLRDSPSHRVLVGLRSSGRRPLRQGYDVTDSSGIVRGQITSGCVSPSLGFPIAMAYVDPSEAAPDTQLTVPVRGSTEHVVVVPLPFYSRV